ncbi:MAG: GTP-binding protein, partial [bacterium]
MALINHRTHEIHFKIVYYGPGLCGKTTNLRSLHDKLPPERRGKMSAIATDPERTLFFDFLPIDLGQVNGFLTRFHLYTVPGQVYYKLSRRAVLQGVDGLVFVADSHPSREAANRESLADLNEHLRTLGITGPALARIPWVFQWNKRDLAATLPVARLHAALNPQGWPEFEATASSGAGVSETLRSVCKAVLARLGNASAPAGPGAPAAATPPATTAPAAPVGAPPSIARPGAALGSALPPSAIATPGAPARPVAAPAPAHPSAAAPPAPRPLAPTRPVAATAPSPPSATAPSAPTPAAPVRPDAAVPRT